jgi:hypothetical protein
MSFSDNDFSRALQKSIPKTVPKLKFEKRCIFDPYKCSEDPNIPMEIGKDLSGIRSKIGKDLSDSKYENEPTSTSLIIQVHISNSCSGSETFPEEHNQNQLTDQVSNGLTAESCGKNGSSGVLMADCCKNIDSKVLAKALPAKLSHPPTSYALRKEHLQLRQQLEIHNGDTWSGDATWLPPQSLSDDTLLGVVCSIRCPTVVMS